MTQNDSQEGNAALRRLDALIGGWNVEVTFPGDPSTVIRGQTTFEWLEGGYFLVERSSAERDDFPQSHQIIGCDDVNEAYSVLYSDSRGVARLYQMSLDDGVWKQWRNAPGFSQRFTGTFSGDGNTIRCFWENSTDGSSWALDFHMTYIKVAAG